jgi:DNA-binding transcriptional LysR family regulator
MDTLDLMRSYLAVVDTDSFTAAGAKLGKSKALVSKHVLELESRLGARLLNRTTRSIGVTEIGRAYYDRAHQIVADVANLEESIRSEATSPRGILKLTAPLTLGEMSVTAMASAFRRQCPAVELDILLADRMVDLIGEGFDIALRVTAFADSSLIARKLCDMRMPLCASKAYLERHGAPKRPEDLVDHACILDTNLRWRDNWRFERDGKPLIVKVRPVFSVNSAGAVRDALLSGIGIGFCPEFAVAQSIESGALVTLFDDMATFTFGVYLVYPHRHHLSAKVRAFFDFALDWYTPHPPWHIHSANPVSRIGA